MTEEVQLDSNEREPRPGFLTVLCVLTFIWTGLNLIIAIFSLIGGKPTEEQLLADKVEMAKSISELKSLGADWMVTQLEKSQLMAQDMANNFMIAMMVGTLVVALGLYSAIQMFKGVKLGFKLYIAYCLLTVVQLYLFSPPAHIPTFAVVISLLLSGIFIFMYSRNLKWMR